MRKPAAILFRSVCFCHLLLAVFIFTGSIASAQVAGTPDSTPPKSLVEKLQQSGREEAMRSIDKFVSEKKRLKQNELIRQLQSTIQNAKNYLKGNFDATAVSSQLAKAENWHDIAGDGVFTNKGTAQTHRNLTTTEKLLNELLQRVAGIKKRVDEHQHKLYAFQYQIDSLYSDSVLYDFPSDSVSTARYFQLLVHTAKEIAPTDSLLRNSIDRNELLQYKVNGVLNKISYSLDEVTRYEAELFSNTFSRDFSNIWTGPSYHRPLGQIMHYALQKGTLTLGFYIQNHTIRLIVCFLIILCLGLFLTSLKKMVKEQHHSGNFAGQLVLRYPALSAFIIGTSLLQFLFPDPPFIFDAILWMASAVSLSFIFKGYITSHWMKIWLTLFFLFIMAAADNLVLQASRTERWWILLLTLAGIFFPAAVLLKANRQELREKAILWFIGLVIVMELPALAANIFGRYNLGKTLMVSGFVNVITAIVFLWVVKLINQILKLASIAYSRQDKKLFYINFEKVGDRVPGIFYALLVLGWFVLFARNFYAFKLIKSPVEDFLLSERTIGDFTFSISNIFLFLFIIVLSAIASKLVSFFASDPPGHHTSTATSKARAKLGSWLLLIRIFIISLGVFLAFAATGIPMDKLTIILGALSVGIGLGLQALVNNLVSGLILAFEKPVNVGDLVQIGGQTGRMKSIGFRGSVIATPEGADVTIPNGEILNSHLINWTMGGKNSRRVDITIGVGYQSDLDLVTTLVQEIIATDERVLQYPDPTVLVNNLNSSSIELQMLFWVQDVNVVSAVKSDIIKSITRIFKDKNIEIPYPQQDIHIRTSIDETKKDDRPGS